MGSINNLSSSYLQSILNNALPGSDSTTNSTGNTATNTSTSNVDAGSLLQTQADSGGLSPFAQMISTLQQIQQSNPAEYQQVTKQIATNLQSAAQTAQADGNTSAANELNTLATDFSNASQNNQLPNIQDLANALGGHHHHHHHGGGGGASFQSDSSENDALNPLSIITSTLAS